LSNRIFGCGFFAVVCLATVRQLANAVAGGPEAVNVRQKAKLLQA
jgi:hypothetical protein